jgi:hypothetical protein
MAIGDPPAWSLGVRLTTSDHMYKNSTLQNVTGELESSLQICFIVTDYKHTVT